MTPEDQNKPTCGDQGELQEAIASFQQPNWEGAFVLLRRKLPASQYKHWINSTKNAAENYNLGNRWHCLRRHKGKAMQAYETAHRARPILKAAKRKTSQIL